MGVGGNVGRMCMAHHTYWPYVRPRWAVVDGIYRFGIYRIGNDRWWRPRKCVTVQKGVADVGKRCIWCDRLRPCPEGEEQGLIMYDLGYVGYAWVVSPTANTTQYQYLCGRWWLTFQARLSVGTKASVVCTQLSSSMGFEELFWCCCSTSWTSKMLPH